MNIRDIVLGITCAAFFSACSTLPYEQGVMPKADVAQASANSTYEAPGMVDIHDFIPSDMIQTPLYTIDQYAYNDGEMNTYRVVTEDHAFIVEGTSQLVNLIVEIEAINKLRDIKTVDTMAKGAAERAINLIQTPAGAVGGLLRRFSQEETLEGQLMTVPDSLSEVSANVTEGAIQLTNTGKRIATSAAGTSCAGFEACVSKGADDIWSGFNSLMGKHNAARELHAVMGTDFYTDNKVLRREIDRLAYADAYTSTIVKAGFTWSGIPILDPLATGVGYYNNVEFLAAYQDASVERNREKEAMRSWGVAPQIVETLYDNPSYTHSRRKLLFNSLSNLATPQYRIQMVERAAEATSKREADQIIRVYAHLHKLQSDGQIKAYVKGLHAAIVLDHQDHLILPIAADFLRYTKTSDARLRVYQKLANSDPRYQGADIHILGHASQAYMAAAKALDINVSEYNLLNHE